MNSEIKRKLKIAIALVYSSRSDGYGQDRITHHERDFITAKVAEILENILCNLDQKTDSIVPKNQSIFNPPDES